jgi:mannitol-1-phosphate 5-dehydrogenase
MKRTFVGFGFGPIQGGLFLYEAFQSGNFDRLVVAEIVPDVVRALRAAGGRYRVNVATRTGLETREVTGIEVLHPVEDRAALVAAVAEAKEVATALPSVEFFDRGEASVAKVLAAGFAGKREACVVYTGENHNHAAEVLETKAGTFSGVQYLNTVIGKMSGVIGQGASREFLVEEFNRILITKITLPGFQRGITAFEEKPDLLPFEEAKLYGHNATHALLGYLANRQGCRFMSDADAALRQFAREAFVEEAGKALVAKYAGIDPLFTPTGFAAYADDLMERMVNPWLRDAIDRVIRDPRRKLGWNDRLIGTMRLAFDDGITPHRFAKGAAAAWELVGGELDDLWPEATEPMKSRLAELIRNAGA